MVESRTLGSFRPLKWSGRAASFISAADLISCVGGGGLVTLGFYNFFDVIVSNLVV